MTSIPERNLNPPKATHELCPNPDCLNGWVWHVNEYGFYEKEICPTCEGDGVIPKAELEREIRAAQADKAHDEKRDRKMREEEGK